MFIEEDYVGCGTVEERTPMVHANELKDNEVKLVTDEVEEGKHTMKQDGMSISGTCLCLDLGRNQKQLGYSTYWSWVQDVYVFGFGSWKWHTHTHTHTHRGSV